MGGDSWWKRPDRLAPFWGNANLCSRKTLRFAGTFLEREKEKKNERGAKKGRCFFSRLNRGKA
jgi:hypothetical protein